MEPPIYRITPMNVAIFNSLSFNPNIYGSHGYSPRSFDTNSPTNNTGARYKTT